ncbi:ATP-binding protein [Streptomyces sp. MST-110588]|uniref:ATP-binding protein n=1 Tax=Streptomyces sp. MST-110588 TaxID=2833628 RepID=UPI001F5D4D78|nr:ATP-binding protein [Streptomyces sp. MST-110588]UNO40555.1 ATP-binding protein [Streptomyces sp. MST-110588]
MCSSIGSAVGASALCDFSLVFPPDPGWVRAAREAVRAALCAAGREGLVDTALLLTSEVVTNAVKACRSSGCSAPVTLYAEWTGPGTLRVLVQDGAPGVPCWGRAAGDEEGGRGLLLVGAWADEWGVCRHVPGVGKAVWFEVAEKGR